MDKNETIKTVIQAVELAKQEIDTLYRLSAQNRESLEGEINGNIDKQLDKISTSIDEWIDERITLSLAGKIKKTARKPATKQEEIDLL